MYPVILASASPRRKELLAGLGIDFEVIPSNVEEIYPNSLEHKTVPEYLAEIKAESLVGKYHEHIIIAADTIVLLEDEILGKPNSTKDAYNMLEKLSGKKHEVITGVCLRHLEKKIVFSDTTEVIFKRLSEKEIRFYIDKFQPFDKAGSYGVQEWIGYVAVEKIIGSFYNVMGLPVNKVYSHLQELNK